MHDPFLIDECLTLDLVALAHSRGHHATHVVFRQRQGAQDRALMTLIREEGFIMVTSNARDFRALYAAEDLHAGLVIIPGGIAGKQQVRLFEIVLSRIEPVADLMNKVVEVFIDGRVEICGRSDH